MTDKLTELKAYCVVCQGEHEPLKACPFCGGDDAWIWPTGVLFPNMPKGFGVTCKNCNAGGHWDENRKEAIKAWNRRAND